MTEAIVSTVVFDSFYALVNWGGQSMVGVLEMRMLGPGIASHFA